MIRSLAVTAVVSLGVAACGASRAPASSVAAEANNSNPDGRNAVRLQRYSSDEERPHRADYGGCYVEDQPLDLATFSFDHTQLAAAWSLREVGQGQWSHQVDGQVWPIELQWRVEAAPPVGNQIRWGSCGPGVDVPLLVVPLSVHLVGSVGAWPVDVVIDGTVSVGDLTTGYGMERCVEVGPEDVAGVPEFPPGEGGTLCIVFPGQRGSNRGELLTIEVNEALPSAGRARMRHGTLLGVLSQTAQTSPP